MPATYSLDQLKLYHNEATQFLATELMLMKEAITGITDGRLGKTPILLHLHSAFTYNNHFMNTWLSTTSSLFSSIVTYKDNG